MKLSMRSNTDRYHIPDIQLMFVRHLFLSLYPHASMMVRFYRDKSAKVSVFQNTYSSTHVLFSEAIPANLIVLSMINKILIRLFVECYLFRSTGKMISY